jgi:hypothetical protein
MCWSLFHPHPLAVIVAMSIGQTLGTLSLLAFIVDVITDLRHARFAAQDGSLPSLRRAKRDLPEAMPGGSNAKRSRGAPSPSGDHEARHPPESS